MTDAVELSEEPKAENIYLLAGWRQWADAGAVSSGLPEYLIQQTQARRIGAIRPDGFYLFQIPGTHDLVRPVVQFKDGYPESLQTQRNEFYYAGDERHGTIFFQGDEPHLDVERYTSALLEVAQALGVKRMIGFGGVYGELPYDRERLISCIYSLPHMKAEMSRFAVSLSDYHGGASIGSHICRRAGEKGIEYAGLYAFVPTYDFSSVAEIGNAIRVESDYMAWLGVMRRVNYMIKLNMDLSDLEVKSRRLVEVIDARMEEFARLAPEFDVREYLKRISDDYTEMPFDPLDEIWEEELRRLLDKFDSEDDS
jgi:proteasome assembly chaperone (PAC2) family protein